MSVLISNLTVNKYVKPFCFYNFDTEKYNISFYANDNSDHSDWYIDQLEFSSVIEAQNEIDTIYC
jgi:hypothetical protein